MTFAIDISAEVARVAAQPASAHAEALALAARVRLNVAQARNISGLTVGELVPFSSPGQRSGLYVIFEGNAAVYVGSCRAQPFSVRLLAHLSSGGGDFLNTLARRWQTHRLPAGPLAQAAAGAAASCAVLLLTVSPGQLQGVAAPVEQRSALLRLERELQGALSSAWNGHAPIAPLPTEDEVEVEARVVEEAAWAQHRMEGGDADSTWGQQVSGALKQLGVGAGQALLVRVGRSWRASDSAAERQRAVLGDWRCSRDRAAGVKVVVGVADGAVVEAWAVTGIADGGLGERVRFKAADGGPVPLGDGLSLPDALLKGQFLHYIR